MCLAVMCPLTVMAHCDCDCDCDYAMHVTYEGIAGHEQRRGEEIGRRAEGNL